MKVYLIKSLNSDKSYVDYTSFKYPSQLLHNMINKYLTFIKNKKKFHPVFNIIDLNDVYVDIIYEDDNLDNIVKFMSKYNNIMENEINNNFEKINVVKSPSIEKNINYHKLYYNNNKDKYVKDENVQKKYYEDNKKILKEKSKKYYRTKKIEERSKYSVSILNFIN
jgi:Ni,Fe-hydrogenase I large subunit